MLTRTRKSKTAASLVQRKPIKKRKYSRAGCEECKRRKMKCDEGKPECYNCSRLRKVCVYRPRGSFSMADEKTSESSKKDETADVERTGYLPVKHYLPSTSGAYLNSFVLDTKPLSHLSGLITGALPKYATMAPLQRITIRHLESPGNFSSQESPPDAMSLKPPSIGPDYPSLSPPNLVPEIENKIAKTEVSSRPSFTNAISDILTPSDTNDYAIAQHDVLELKNLFDEASLLVNDMNDLVSLDLLGHMDEPLAHPLLDRSHGALSGSPMINTKSPTTSDVKLISDTFEKHDFQIDEFSQRFINNQNNGQYSGEYDVSSPQLVTVNHLQEAHTEPNSELIEKLIDQHHLTDPHIKYLRFLNDPVMSLNYFPFASSIENNEVVSILLKYANNCPYLLSAMLSMSATVQYNITGKQVHDMSRQKYISVCLKALSKAFAENSSSRVDQFLNDIERLLLTVLVLTSNFSSITSTSTKDNILNSWKTHLRGAKDLLVNYSHTTKSHHRLTTTGGLALAKSWFFAIEALAGFTTTLGGTLSQNKQKHVTKTESIVSNQTDEDSPDHDKSVFADTGYFSKEANPEYHDALRSIGLVTLNNHPESTEFHLFLGFTMEVVLLIQEFTKALDILRANDLSYQFSAQKIAKLMEPINKAQEAIIAPQVNFLTYEIPPTSPAHPNFSKFDPSRIELPAAAYCKFINHAGEEVYYLYFDVSQRCHVDSIYLRILVLPGFFKLPRDHPLVKELIDKLMKCLFFIISKDSPDFELRKDKIVAETDHYIVSLDMFDPRAFMIQSPYRLIVKLVQDEDILERIETYFRGLVKLGNGSALSALDDLEKRRKFLESRNSQESEDDQANTLLDYTDSVPFV